MTEKCNEDIASKTKQSLLWYTLLPFILHFVRFASSIWLARILMPSDFGVIGIITVLFYYCDLVTEFGLSNAIIQRKNATSKHFNSYFVFNILISLCFFILFLFSAQAIADFFDEPSIKEAIQVFSFMFMISAFIAAPQASLKRDLNFKVLAQIEAVSVAISICVSLLLALNDFGYWSMIWGMLSSQLTVLILTYIACSIKLRFEFSWPYLKQLMSFGVWDFLWGQAILLGENIDKIIIGKYLGTTYLGFYDKALGLAQMPNSQIAKRLSMVSFSSFSRVQGDKEAVDNYFTKMMVINAFICFPIFIGLAGVAENLTIVLLGEKWRPMIESLAVLSIAYLVSSITCPIISMNMAGGKIRTQTIIRFICVLALISGLLYMVQFGIYAASFTILGFYSLQFILSYFLLNHAFSIRWSKTFDYFFAPILSSSVMFVVVLLVKKHVLIDMQGVNLLLSILLGGVSYSLCFLFIPFSSWLFLRQNVFSKLSVLKLRK